VFPKQVPQWLLINFVAQDLRSVSMAAQFIMLGDADVVLLVERKV
jgi:acetyl-CoA acetyltransferase